MLALRLKSPLELLRVSKRLLESASGPGTSSYKDFFSTWIKFILLVLLLNIASL